MHRVWAYPGIDRRYVTYDTAPEHARTAPRRSSAVAATAATIGSMTRLLRHQRTDHESIATARGKEPLEGRPFAARRPTNAAGIGPYDWPTARELCPDCAQVHTKVSA